MARLVLSGSLSLVCLNVFSDTTELLTRALAKAHAGQESMDVYAAKAAQGDGAGAQEAHESAQGSFSEVVSLCAALNPEKFESSDDARVYGEAMVLSGNFDLAARGYERAYGLLPEDYATGLLAARNWRRVGGGGGNGKAFEILKGLRRKVSSEDSLSGGIDTELGRVYHEKGLFELAMTSYAAAMSSESSTVDTVIGDAVLSVRRGRFDYASSAIAGLGSLTAEQGRFLDMELTVALAAVDELRVPIGDQHYSYGMLLVRVGQNYEAMLAIEHAVMLDDTRYAIYNLLGGLLMQQGLSERGAAAYRRSLALNPDQERTRGILEQIESSQ